MLKNKLTNSKFQKTQLVVILYFPQMSQVLIKVVSIIVWIQTQFSSTSTVRGQGKCSRSPDFCDSVIWKIYFDK